MVNHLYTLIANPGPGDQLPHYVDPTYIRAPDSCPGVKALKWLSNGDPAGCADTLLWFASLPDLDRYSSFFDCRTTIGKRGGYDIVSFHDAESSSGAASSIASAYLSAYPPEDVFASVGKDSVDAMLSELKAICRGSFEAPVRIGAFVLAAAMRIEMESSHG